jgi:5'-3' exonuclease
METILIDGEWNLKRNFIKRTDMFARGEHCGGSYGSLESIRSVVNRIMPDRTVVFWDGLASGTLRKEMYPLYKKNRDKSFIIDDCLMNERQFEHEKNRKYSQIQQKIKVKNYLEELFIRQLELEEIEADDLIALYVKKRRPDEKITIFSSDKDFYQLIDDNVCVLRPSDNKIINKENFKKEFGYIIENTLFLRCFEGDTSDNIHGVNGVTLNQLSKHFPKFLDERYSLDRLLFEAQEKYSEKKLKVFEKIIESRSVLERNRTLMNLKRPFVTEEAKREVVELANYAIVDPDNSDDRSIKTAMRMIVADGYKQFIFQEDMELFFRPFYRLMMKEKEYSSNLLNE